MNPNGSKVLFPSEEWMEEFVKKVNGSETYAQAASTWEGDFIFVIEPDGTGGLTEQYKMYRDLWHGKCRKAFVITEETGEPEAAYIWSGKYANWLKLLNGDVGPIKALMQRKFKLKGDYAKVMRATKAAQELVKCTTMVENVEYL
jgi:putative sterol carrier protein